MRLEILEMCGHTLWSGKEMLTINNGWCVIDEDTDRMAAMYLGGKAHPAVYQKIESAAQVAAQIEVHGLSNQYVWVDLFQPYQHFLDDPYVWDGEIDA